MGIEYSLVLIYPIIIIILFMTAFDFFTSSNIELSQEGVKGAILVRQYENVLEERGLTEDDVQEVIKKSYNQSQLEKMARNIHKTFSEVTNTLKSVGN